MHYLDKTAASAIASFRPLLVSANDGPRASVRDQALFARLSYELTTLPPWPTFIATLLGAVFAILPFLQTSTGSLVRRSTEGVPSFLAGTAGTELSNVTMVSSFFLQSAIFGVLIYHTLHQLLLISRIYTQHARINIYRLQPLYALSLPCALTGIGIILWLSTWLAASPSSVQAVGPGEIVFLVPIVAVAGAIFVLPLWGAHRRLVAEKDRRLAESSSLFEDTTSELHRQLYRGRLHRMDQLNRALANLEIEQVALRRIPTWPWQPGTVRGLGAALLLPLVAWGLQQWLGRLLGA